jgi:hypothetical protein
VKNSQKAGVRRGDLSSQAMTAVIIRCLCSLFLAVLATMLKQCDGAIAFRLNV